MSVMEPKFTTGPLSVQMQHAGLAVVDVDNGDVFLVATWVGDHAEESRANAQAAAALPDMFFALRELVVALEGSDVADDFHAVLVAGQHALAKAAGDPS